ncbi:mechanosensitive ion channel family protein [Anaerococcus provencensis]|uniref:mechanosensitive ion channel family protein n=1 Tax=Anaerococcus provencensis TaxID=938293 RepID=UPI0003013F44|nr:mechanosensitive ion channel domain-containing protein [Anaerococcus provencensis]
MNNIEKITKAGVIKDLILVVIVIVLGKLLLEAISRIIKKAFDDKMDQDGYRKVRIETLTKNLYSVVKFILGFIIVMIILDMIGVNTRSIIATAGIGGGAIAFGAQTLVKDIVTGTIIIVDDTFRVGDWIKAAGVEGTVETLGMRHTKIRDYDGSLHTIPNSQITNVQNLNSGPIKFECNIYLSYEVSYQELEEIVKNVGEKLKANKDLAKYILKDVSLFGIMEMNERSYVAKTTGIAMPGYQWALAREERKIIIEEIYQRNLNPSTQVVAVTKGKDVNEEI